MAFGRRLYTVSSVLLLEFFAYVNPALSQGKSCSIDYLFIILSFGSSVTFPVFFFPSVVVVVVNVVLVFGPYLAVLRGYS